ncbi:MAG TPA: hypothetical protein VGV93_09120 [Acidimicrobiales bacterium]|nr:hypothetical protein [Acidimicrobiales bacterium]
MDDDDLASVVPLRSHEEELVVLETAVLDRLDEEDDTQPADQPLDDNVVWLARYPAPPTRRRPSRA